jgi:hypothetical protein
MKFITILLLPLLLLTGCVKHIERPNYPTVYVDPAPKGQINATYSLSLFNADLGAYTAASRITNCSAAVDCAATIYRNRLVYGVMAEIDYVYSQYEVALYLNDSKYRTSTEILQLALGTAASSVGGMGTRTILSQVLVGVTGASFSIDKNFFRQHSIDSIVNSMQAGRDQVKAKIISQLSQPDSVYPFQAARSDLTSYFSAGTLPGGLQAINQASAVGAAQQRQNLYQIQVKH